MRHAPETIERAKALWISGVMPGLIADALTAEFNRKITIGAVHGMAYRNDFPPAPQSSRSGRPDSESFLARVEIKAQSETYLIALREGECPLFDDVGVNQ